MNALLNITVRVNTGQALTQVKALSGTLRAALNNMQPSAFQSGAAAGMAQWGKQLEDASARAIKFGKNMQWTGRQLQFAFTLPVLLAGGAATKFAMDNERAFTQLKKVYGVFDRDLFDVNAELNVLKQTMETLSNTFGINRAQVTEVAKDWAEAGMAGAGLQRSVVNTLTAATVGSIDLKEATQGLITVQAAYGLSSEQLTQALAELNTIQVQSGISFEGMLQVVQRAGGVAGTAGIDIRHLAAMAAAIVPAAGSAEQAGNGLRTVISRLFAPTKQAAAQMREMGIMVDDVTWKSLNGAQRIETFAKGWEKLSGDQKVAADTLVFTRFQQNKSDVLIRDITKSNGFYWKSLTATNDAVKTQKLYQEQLLTVLQSSPQKMKIMWTMMQNALANIIVPMIPTILTLVHAILNLVTWFHNLSPEVRTFVLYALLLLAALGPLIKYVGALYTLFGVFFKVIGSGLGLMAKFWNYFFPPPAALTPFQELMAEVQALQDEVAAASVVATTTVKEAWTSVGQTEALLAEAMQEAWTTAFAGMEVVSAEAAEEIATTASVATNAWTAAIVAQERAARASFLAREEAFDQMVATELPKQEAVDAAIIASRSEATAEMVAGARVASTFIQEEMVKQATAAEESAAATATAWEAAFTAIETEAATVAPTVSQILASLAAGSTAAAESAATAWTAAFETVAVEMGQMQFPGMAETFVTQQSLMAQEAEAAATATTVAWNTAIASVEEAAAAMPAAFEAALSSIEVAEFTASAQAAQAWNAAIAAQETATTGFHTVWAETMASLETETAAAATAAAATWAEAMAVMAAETAAAVTAMKLQMASIPLQAGAEGLAAGGAIAGGMEAGIAAVPLAIGVLVTAVIGLLVLRFTDFFEWVGKMIGNVLGTVGILTGFSKRPTAPSGISTPPIVGGTRGAFTVNNQKVPAGQLAAPTLDVHDRPVVSYEGGTATVRSITITGDKGEAIVIPTVLGPKPTFDSAPGRVVSDQEAIAHFKQTGEHLGVFENETLANKYAEQLHRDQAKEYAGRKPGSTRPFTPEERKAIAKVPGSQYVPNVAKSKDYAWDPKTKHFEFTEEAKQRHKAVREAEDKTGKVLPLDKTPMPSFPAGAATAGDKAAADLKAKEEAGLPDAVPGSLGEKKTAKQLAAEEKAAKKLQQQMAENKAAVDAFRNLLPELSQGIDETTTSMDKQSQSLENWKSRLDEANKRLEIAKSRMELLDVAPDIVPQFDAIVASLDDLHEKLEVVRQDMTAQQAVVDDLKKSLDAANTTLKEAEREQDRLKQTSDALKTALGDAKDKLSELANTPIKGMKEMSDKIFENEMAQKRLRLEILRLEQASGSVDDLNKKLSELHGTYEDLLGQKLDLQSAGAGSDVLGPFDDELNRVREAIAGMEGMGNEAGKSIDELQKKLDQLELEGQILDLTNSLQFDPLKHQIDEASKSISEMPFDELLGKIVAQKGVVDQLTAAWQLADAETQKQTDVVTALKLARDEIQQTYDAENEKLSVLKGNYDALNTSINTIEGSLTGLVQQVTSGTAAMDAMANQAGVDFDKVLRDAQLAREGALKEMQQFQDELQKRLEEMNKGLDKVPNPFQAIADKFKEAMDSILNWVAEKKGNGDMQVELGPMLPYKPAPGILPGVPNLSPNSGTGGGLDVPPLGGRGNAAIGAVLMKSNILYAMGGIPESRVGSGFVTRQPRAIVGEGSNIYPEFVIPTDPQHRLRALDLYKQLGTRLMAEGGLLFDKMTATSAGEPMSSVTNKNDKTELHFHGDLSFPNVRDGADAEAFVRNLESLSR